MKQVTVLSAGTWGITLAVLLANKGQRVRVWEFATEVVEELTRTRRHPKLGEMTIPDELVITQDMAVALEKSDCIVCAVPASHVRTTCKTLAQVGYNGQLFVICSKGIEEGTHELLADVARAELGAAAVDRIGVLSGPSHAEEVSRNIPTAVAAAAVKLATAEEIRDLFITPRFRIYTQTDLIGVELGAALKNVVAIACGISDGLGFGDNSKAALITRGLSEIVRLSLSMGANAETFFGLAGIGDLVVTAMSQHSRNWKFGNFLGQGQTPEQALESVGMVVEGHYTVRAAVELAQANGVDMPITEAVASVIFKGVPALKAVTDMLARDPKSEMES